MFSLSYTAFSNIYCRNLSATITTQFCICFEMYCQQASTIRDISKIETEYKITTPDTQKQFSIAQTFHKYFCIVNIKATQSGFVLLKLSVRKYDITVSTKGYSSVNICLYRALYCLGNLSLFRTF